MMRKVFFIIFFLITAGIYYFKVRPVSGAVTYSLFADPPYSDTKIIGSTIPASDEVLSVGEPLTISAAKGELTSSSFAIYNDSGTRLQKISVSVSAFTNGVNVINSDNTGIFVVKVQNKRQNAITNINDPGYNSVESPEYFIPNSIEYLHNGAWDIATSAENHTKQFWLDIQVPADAPAGDYTATIQIAPQNGVYKQIPLKLHVYDFILQKSSDKAAGLYFTNGGTKMLDCHSGPCQTINLASDYDIYVKQHFALMSKYGVQMIVSDQGPGYDINFPSDHPENVTANDVTFDWTLVETQLRRAKEFGLNQKPFVSNGIYFSLRKLMGEITDKTGWDPVSTKYRNFQQEVYNFGLRGLRDLVLQYNSNGVLFYPKDEPFNRGAPETDRKALIASVNLTKNAIPDAKIYTTVYLPEWYGNYENTYDQYVDYLVFNSSISNWNTFEKINNLSKFTNALSSKNNIAWMYFNNPHPGQLQERRVQHGVFLWMTPLKVNVPWTYQHIIGDPFDDFDPYSRFTEGSQDFKDFVSDWGRHGDSLYAYPDIYNNYAPMATLKFVGLREGAKDLSYLETLKLAINLSSNNSAKNDANKYLADLKSKLENMGSADTIAQRYSPSDLEIMRQKIADLVVALNPKFPSPTINRNIPTGSVRKPIHAFVGTPADNNNKFIWVSSPGRQFTNEEFTQLAQNYQIVVIGNAHGNFDQASYNEVANRLTLLNPNIKVFPYYNTTRSFDIINSGSGFNDNWYLQDSSGNRVYDDDDNNHTHPYYDLSKAAYRNWVVTFITNWVQAAPFAGIALDDANPQELQSWKDQIGQAKANAWNAGRVEFFRQVKRALGSKLVIYNGITNDYSEFLDNDSADGALNEMFCYQRNTQVIFNKAKQINQIEFMRQYGRQGKLIMEKTNLDPNPQHSTNPTPNPVEKSHITRLCLGSFMLGYVPSQTYYKAGPGYRTDLGEVETNALESGLNFGNPIGNYQAEGKVLKRKFENGWIYVNFESSPENIRVPERLIYANGGVEGHVYSAGDDLVLRPHDGAYLLKSAAFLVPTSAPTSTPTSTPTLPVPTLTGPVSPTITPGGPTVTYHPSPTSPAGGGIFNYDVGASLSSLASDPLNILGAVVILFFLIY